MHIHKQQNQQALTSKASIWAKSALLSAQQGNKCQIFFFFGTTQQNLLRYTICIGAILPLKAPYRSERLFIQGFMSRPWNERTISGCYSPPFFLLFLIALQ